MEIKKLPQEKIDHDNDLKEIIDIMRKTCELLTNVVNVELSTGIIKALKFKNIKLPEEINLIRSFWVNLIHSLILSWSTDNEDPQKLLREIFFIIEEKIKMEKNNEKITH